MNFSMSRDWEQTEGSGDLMVSVEVPSEGNFNIRVTKGNAILLIKKLKIAIVSKKDNEIVARSGLALVHFKEQEWGNANFEKLTLPNYSFYLVFF